MIKQSASETALPTKVPVQPERMIPPLPTLTASAVLPTAPAVISTISPPGDLVETAANPSEPAGCLSQGEQSGRTIEEMLAYADQLLSLRRPLKNRMQKQAWNPYVGKYVYTGESSLAFGVADVQNQYMLQEMLNALHVAGFTAWLRRNQWKDLQIVAVPLRDPNILQSSWGDYVSAYWQDSHSLPQKDSAIIPALKLSPCRWMLALGFAPQTAVWSLVAGSWTQPDFGTAGRKYLASNSQAAMQVARGIDWIAGSSSEAPDLMCGPLTWAIQNEAGAFPPGIGGWSKGPISFWLPNPERNGRPWSFFPAWLYTVQHISKPVQEYDFSQNPLYPGDMLYFYSKGSGFDHVLTITEVDDQKNVVSVTNMVKVKPVKEITIRPVTIYNAADPSVGVFRHEWFNDPDYGKTGQHGFDIFRWAWREKDISGQAAEYHVLPGDTLPLVAAVWKTPPELIAQANQISTDTTLIVGQVLIIPPNTSN